MSENSISKAKVDSKKEEIEKTMQSSLVKEWQKWTGVKTFLNNTKETFLKIPETYR